MVIGNLPIDIDKIDVKKPENISRIVLDFMQMKDFAQHPFILQRADGIKYWDVNGKEYLDCLSGIFNVSVGHRNRRVIEAINSQLEEITFAPPLHGTTTIAIKLGSLLKEVTPKGLDTFKILSSGSEATEGAIKMARQYHTQTGHAKKFKVISMYYGYHGATMGALSATGTIKRKWVAEPLLTGFVHAFPSYCYRCPLKLNYPECGIRCATILEDIIKNEGPETVSSIIIEPINNTGGVLTPPPEYFKILREICDKFNVILIYDEIVTGFGRLGKFFGAQVFGVNPDILVTGKGMGGGYIPLSAIGFTDKIKEAFWGSEEIAFAHGHTYAGNPLACAVGIACINELIERNLPENAANVGKHLVSRLDKLNDYGILGEVRGKGLLIGAEFVEDPETKKPFTDLYLAEEIARIARENGLVMIHRTVPDVVQFAPPLIVTNKDVDMMLDIFFESVETAVKNLK